MGLKGQKQQQKRPHAGQATLRAVWDGFAVFKTTTFRFEKKRRPEKLRAAVCSLRSGFWTKRGRKRHLVV